MSPSEEAMAQANILIKAWYEMNESASAGAVFQVPEDNPVYEVEVTLDPEGLQEVLMYLIGQEDNGVRLWRHGKEVVEPYGH